VKANLGGLDQGIRIIVGIVLLALGLMAGLETPWNYIVGGVGLILILTAGIKFCPLYVVIDVSTCNACRKGD
jgi:hypothetical protein